VYLFVAELLYKGTDARRLTSCHLSLAAREPFKFSVGALDEY